MEHTPEWLDVADAIDQLRAQLAQARINAAKAIADGGDVLFTVGKAEVELALEARKEVGGGFSFKVWVAGADGKASFSSGNSHKLKIELIPHDLNGAPIDVNSRSATLPPR